MKTSPLNLITGTLTASARHVRHLSPSRLLLLLAFCGIVFGASHARANVSFLNPISGAVGNYGAKCNPAHPLNIFVVSNFNCMLNSPWTITVTDGNISTPNSVTVGPLAPGIGFPAQLLTMASLTPTLNLTGLDPGPGTLVATDPCGNTTTIGFNIVSCSSGAALVPLLGYENLIAPNRSVTFSAHVANAGTAGSSATTLEITGIPPVSDCTVITVTPGMTVVNLGTSQKITVPIGVIAVGGQQSFLYTLQATPSAVVGSTFTLNAAFTSLYPYTDTRLVTVVASIDPNFKYGPTGTGPLHNISPNLVMPYLVTFENDPAAPAPAQIVSITDQLDTTKLDPFTFAFGPVHFGSKIVLPPAGVIPFSVTVPYDVDGNPGTLADNIYVRVSGDVDQNPYSGTYGKVDWLLESLDAPGGNPPPIMIGLLPANITQPEGDGGVSFTVMQVPNLAHGTLITNAATIVFDVNGPITTPAWTNRIHIPSSLSIGRNEIGHVRLDWTGGTLEQSPNVTGNWTNAPVQVSPWVFQPVGARKFFRVRQE